MPARIRGVLRGLGTAESIVDRFNWLNARSTSTGSQSGASRLPRLNAEDEKKLIAVYNSPPPDGRGCWTLRLLGARLVQSEVVDSISPETVRQVLKKTS